MERLQRKSIWNVSNCPIRLLLNCRQQTNKSTWVCDFGNKSEEDITNGENAQKQRNHSQRHHRVVGKTCLRDGGEFVFRRNAKTFSTHRATSTKCGVLAQGTGVCYHWFVSFLNNFLSCTSVAKRICFSQIQLWLVFSCFMMFDGLQHSHCFYSLKKWLCISNILFYCFFFLTIRVIFQLWCT